LDPDYGNASMDIEFGGSYWIAVSQASVSKIDDTEGRLMSRKVY